MSSHATFCNEPGECGEVVDFEELKRISDGIKELIREIEDYLDIFEEHVANMPGDLDEHPTGTGRSSSHPDIFDASAKRAAVRISENT